MLSCCLTRKLLEPPVRQSFSGPVDANSDFRGNIFWFQFPDGISAWFVNLGSEVSVASHWHDWILETSNIECWPLEPTKTHQTKKCKYQTKKLKTRHSIGMTPKRMEASTKRLDPTQDWFEWIQVERRTVKLEAQHRTQGSRLFHTRGSLQRHGWIS